MASVEVEIPHCIFFPTNPVLCLLNLTASFSLALLIITLPLDLGSSNNKLIDPEIYLNGPGKCGKLSSPEEKKDRGKGPAALAQQKGTCVSDESISISPTGFTLHPSV